MNQAARKQIETSSTVYSQTQKEEAARWFAELRDKICAEFEKIEQDYISRVPSPESRIPHFIRKDWDRATPDNLPGGGGTMAILHGNVFEKVGVNISAVYGHLSPEFRKEVPGAEEDLAQSRLREGGEASVPQSSRAPYKAGGFWAAGISLVAHPANPFVPAVHMNTRCIVTSKGWFGGGADLTPVFPDANDTAAFHGALKKACDAQSPDFYARYKEWCDDYFFIKHRNEMRGVGGIFFDYHDTGAFDADFAFVRNVGLAFLEIYPKLVRASMQKPFGEKERAAQLVKRGRYAEFNLVYDRGTKFGLMTGGNIDAILMSLPPMAAWP